MKKRKIKLLVMVLAIVLSIVGCSKGNEDNKENEGVKNNIQESNYIHLTMLVPKTINPILNTDKSVSSFLPCHITYYIVHDIF